MATVVQPSSADSSIQNRDDMLIARSRDEYPFSSQPATDGGRIRVLARRKRKNRDMSTPFMILVLMDFLIVLLLWIVYEAQPEANEDKQFYHNGLHSSFAGVQLDDGMVVIRNITLSQLLASLNGTAAQVQFLSNSLQSSNDISDGISFNFEHRLFDLLFLSAIRGLILVVVYGLMRLITRSVIVLTTVASSVMVLIKAAQFDYRRESDCDCLVYILTFFLLALSFAFPWMEFFFLEFNYLPKEIGKYSAINWCSWQAWLWPRKLPIANGVTFDESTIEERPQESRHQYTTGTSMTTSVFVTPQASPPRSPRAGAIGPIPEEPELTVLDQSYIQQGLESLVITEDLLSSMDGWKLERTEGGVVCYSRSVGGKKKWRSESVINANITTVWHVLYDEFEQQTKWNTQINLAQSFYRINDQTDITYVVSAEAGGGLITNRDFVTIRYWECKDGVYYSVGKAATYDALPSQSGKIRGENGPGGYRLTAVDDTHTQFVWLCDTDLKGWLPQYLIDQTIASTATQTHQRLARHIESLTDDDLPLAIS